MKNNKGQSKERSKISKASNYYGSVQFSFSVHKYKQSYHQHFHRNIHQNLREDRNTTFQFSDFDDAIL